jgi:hypothetical protein
MLKGESAVIADLRKDLSERRPMILHPALPGSEGSPARITSLFLAHGS